MKTKERTTVIRDIHLFSCLSDKEIESVARIATESAYQKNTVIIHASDETNALFIIVKGRADAVSIDPNGRQIVLNTFKDGDYFGEMSFKGGNQGVDDFQGPIRRNSGHASRFGVQTDGKRDSQTEESDPTYRRPCVQRCLRPYREAFL